MYVTNGATEYEKTYQFGGPKPVDGFVMVKLKRLCLAAALAALLVFYLAVWQSTTFGGVTTKATLVATNELDDKYDESLLNNTGALCELSYEDRRSSLLNENMPVIYFVTPTYLRAVQMAELTRLGQTLAHVPKIHWVLVEDSDQCSPQVASLLRRTRIPYTHMVNPMPRVFRKEHVHPRGVSNRRAALSWIKNSVKDGVVYFGDDDNTFDLRLFDEIRDTKKISMLPVGLIGEYGVSSPIVENGSVVGFFDPWPAGRRFPVDMAGFAVNVALLHEFPNATIPYKAGYEEDVFLQNLGIEMTDIEPKAHNCSEILVWHTRTVQVKTAHLRLPSDARVANLLQPLFSLMKDIGLALFSKSGLKTNSTLIAS